MVEEVIDRLSPPSSSQQHNSEDEVLSATPIVIWLSGYVHVNDRLALREIGRQLMLQSETADLDFAAGDSDNEDEDGDHADDVFVSGDDNGVERVPRNSKSFLVRRLRPSAVYYIHTFTRLATSRLLRTCPP